MGGYGIVDHLGLGLGYFILEARFFLRVVGFVTRPETLLLFALLGGLIFAMYGMGAWLRGAVEKGEGFWLRWWSIMAVLFGIPMLGDYYLDERTYMAFMIGAWIFFTAVGIRTIIRHRKSTPIVADPETDDQIEDGVFSAGHTEGARGGPRLPDDPR